ncbi:hypothetical protein ABEY65_28295 [Priestia aryabhattai]|uniref:hypothetical protein n=1 Tax=Priestia aryabhattai TaxID=412384 RepID=UPI003D26C7D0
MSVVVKGLSSNMRKIKATVRTQAINGMKTSMKDLTRVASEAAPLDEGDLEMSGFNDVDVHGSEIKGWVGFEAFNKDFNYAIWTHEENYNLGTKSKAKGGGSGLSGTSYEVGKGYLIRPFKGEAKTYRGIIKDDVKQGLSKL